jgi:hypothetical protein
VARRKAKGYAAHVRIYAHEMKTEAWQTLDPDARALLVEMRSLYTGRENRVHMSVREAMRRLSICQRRAQKARDALVERGWIRVVEEGSFTRKVRHATVFALEHEPLTDNDGATAPKSYMTWKNTVVKSATDGSQNGYRGRPNPPGKGPNGSQNEYRKRKNGAATVVKMTTQLVNHRGTDK